MKGKFLFFSLLIGTVLLTFQTLKEKVNLEGLKIKNGSLILEKFELKLPKFSLGFYNLNLSWKKIYLTSLWINVPPSPPEAVYSPYLIRLKETVQSLELLNKILYKLPLEFYISSFYGKFGSFSLDVEKLSFKDRTLKALYIQGFNDQQEVFLITKPKLKVEKKQLTLTPLWVETPFAKVRVEGNFKNQKLELFSKLYPQTVKGYIFANLLLTENRLLLPLEGKFTVQNEEIDLKGRASTTDGKNIKGFLNLENRIVKIRSRFNYNLIEGPKVVFNGRLQKEVCNKNLSLIFGGTLLNQGLYAAYYNPLTELYGWLVYKLEPKGNWIENLRAFAQTKGWELKLEKGILKSLWENYQPPQLCQFQLKTLSGFALLNLRKKDYLAKTSVDGFTYKNLSGGKTQLFLKGNTERLTLKSRGSINADLRVNFLGTLQGQIKTSLLVNNKPLQIDLKKVSFNKTTNLWIGKVYLNKLSFNNIETSQTEVYLKLFPLERKISVDLKGNNQGFLYADLKRETFNGFLKSDISLNGKNLNLSLAAKGNKNSGTLEGNLFDKYLFKVDYQKLKQKVEIALKAATPFVNAQGKALAGENFKDIDFNLSLVAQRGLLPLYFPYLQLYGNIDLEKNTLRVNSLPACFFLFGQQLTCLKPINIWGYLNHPFVEIESFKNQPVEIKVKGHILQNWDLKGLIKLKKVFLNQLLAPKGVYLLKPEALTLAFEIEGSDPLEGLTIATDQQLELISSYLYKPLIAYITLDVRKALANLLVGLTTVDTNVLGTVKVSARLKEPYNLKVENDINNLPLRIFLPNFLSSYINLTVKGTIKGKPSHGFHINQRVGLGGFVKVLSFKPPFGTENKNPKKGEKKLKIHYNVEIKNIQPLYVNLPNGNLLVYIKGRATDKGQNLKIKIVYGRINLLGKNFTVSSATVEIKNGRIYVDLPLIYYATDRTIYLKIYGYLPVENLKLRVYSIPPAPENELLLALFGSGAANAGTQGLLAQLTNLRNLFLSAATEGVMRVVNSLAQQLLGGIKVKFEPAFDPKTGFSFGVDIEKDFGSLAAVGYHWLPSPDPKTTYWWGALKFGAGVFMRLQKYSDNTAAGSVRVIKDFGNPFD